MIDAKKKEDQYIKEKFDNKAEYIDVEARLNIKGLLQTPVAYKYYYKVNLYRELDSIQNCSTAMKEYPQCSDNES